MFTHFLFIWWEKKRDVDREERRVIGLIFIHILYATSFLMVKMKAIPWEGRNLNAGTVISVNYLFSLVFIQPNDVHVPFEHIYFPSYVFTFNPNQQSQHKICVLDHEQ